jgi:HEAT repeat protein
MRILPANLPRLFLPAAVLLLTLPLPGGGPALASEKESSDPEEILRERARVEEPLEILATGDAAARRQVADRAGDFNNLDSDHFNEVELRERSEELRRLVAREEDDWISSRLLRETHCDNSDSLLPMYLDALSSNSPDVRWSAFQCFAKLESPEAVLPLETSWPGEARPWARKDLMEALARNHSTRYLEDFRTLAAGSDPDLSSAAIGAIALLKDLDSLPFLARLVEEGTDPQRREAADALAMAPDPPVAIAALLTATDDQDPLTRACALLALSRSSDPAALARAFATTVSDPVEDVRKAGVSALEMSPWRMSIYELLRAGDWDPEADREMVEDWVKPRLSLRGAPSAIAHDIDGPRFRCRHHPRAGLDADNPLSMRASPPPGMTSSRCFEYPGVPGDLRVFFRVPRGSLLFVEDHFEGHHGPWALVRGFTTPRPCWLLASQVVPAKAEPPPEDEAGILQRDFDVPDGDALDPLIAGMGQAGMIKVIDRTDGMIAYALRVPMDSPKAEPLLRRSIASPASPVSMNVFWMLEDAGKRLCDFPTMVNLARDLGQPVEFCPGAQEDSGESANPLP